MSTTHEMRKIMQFLENEDAHLVFIAPSDLSCDYSIYMMFEIHMSCPFADQCKCSLPLIRDALLQKPFD